MEERRSLRLYLVGHLPLLANIYARSLSHVAMKLLTAAILGTVLHVQSLLLRNVLADTLSYETFPVDRKTSGVTKYVERRGDVVCTRVRDRVIQHHVILLLLGRWTQARRVHVVKHVVPRGETAVIRVWLLATPPLRALICDANLV